MVDMLTECLRLGPPFANQTPCGGSGVGGAKSAAGSQGGGLIEAGVEGEHNKDCRGKLGLIRHMIDVTAWYPGDRRPKGEDSQAWAVGKMGLKCAEGTMYGTHGVQVCQDRTATYRVPWLHWGSWVFRPQQRNGLGPYFATLPMNAFHNTHVADREGYWLGYTADGARWRRAGYHNLSPALPK